MSHRILLLFNSSGSYDRGFLKGIFNYARFNTSWIFLREAPYFKLRKDKGSIINKIVNWKPDAIIMCENFFTSEIISLKIPIILSPFTEIFPNVINVVADDYAIGQMGAEYFMDKNYKYYGYYGTQDSFWSRERKRAFVSTLKSKGFEAFCYESERKAIDFNWENEPYRIAAWLKQLPLPLALMTCADDWSQLVVEAAKITNLRIPEDISVLGVDNDELICESSNPPLSSIKQDSEIIGYEAAYLLDQIIKGNKVPSENIVGAPINIVVRQSTDMLAIKDQNLVKALNYINNNAFEKHLRVEEVVKATNLSRRMLEKKFQQIIGSTIGNKIKQTRLNFISEKLINTDIPIEIIAFEMGFPSSANLSSFFKKGKKVSPLKYRSLHSLSKEKPVKNPFLNKERS